MLSDNLNTLSDFANSLDSFNMTQEADVITRTMIKLSEYKDHEVSMASNELKSIHANAKRLLALVQQYGEQGDLEAWQQSKITKAADYLNSVLQSIGGEHNALDEISLGNYQHKAGMAKALAGMGVVS